MPLIPRWKQRFQNFGKAFCRWEEALMLRGLDDLALNRLIQRFEFTFDLAWKTLKDFLEEGVLVKSPREVVRQGVVSGYITDGQIGMDALQHRKLLSPMYDEQHFREAEIAIRTSYFQVLQQHPACLQSQL